MPNLEWKDETVPIKQSMPVAIIMFGGWALIVALGAFYYFVFMKTSLTAENYLQILMFLFIIVTVVLNRWLDTKGVKHWNEL